MEKTNGFYTLKGYQVHAQAEMTPAMEDYLEMIGRLLQNNEVVRIGELANVLHVKPSSTSRMIQQLTTYGYVNSQRYGYIRMTEKGKAMGDYLLYRHAVLQRFLCYLNKTESELEQVEKIEHFLNRHTVDNLNELTTKLEKGSWP
ncbi:MAG: iron dependent repressor, metal binding and dimerization domain protein [Candidatus Pelethousia sp.]|nr:iron dependent repressor, metal binding and dimerization domain protein [Candidatus Pelethousia sp.]